MDEIEFICAKELEAGDKLVTHLQGIVELEKVNVGIYVSAWINKRQAIPFFPDEVVRIISNG